MKTKIFWTTIAAIDIAIIFLFVTFAHAQDNVKFVEPDCPKGWYLIDEMNCKMEPTGCPYGDSIPLDSPKCAPPEAQDSSTQVLYNTTEPIDATDPSIGK